MALGMGAGNQNILLDDRCRALFMELLSEIDSMFRVEVRVYLFGG